MRQEPVLAGILLAIATGFNLYTLSAEIGIAVPRLNDGTLHLLALQRVASALSSGQNPTDPWFAPVGMGYPLFHYYQHLPYLLPALLAFPFQGALSLADVYSWTNYLLLSFFPLSIYWTMRRFGFSRLQAALSGLVASLLSTNGLYGFDNASYVWRGSGLYTQLWGMVLLPPALAQCYRVLNEGRGYALGVLLLGMTALSHLVFGYIALVSLVAFAFLLPERGAIGRRLRRLACLLIPFTLVTAYFLLPELLDNAYLNRSVWDSQVKYDSYGAGWVLNTLAKGNLFDFNRLPVLTILAALGMSLCIWRRHDERYRVPVALSVLWLLLYFGRPTWGVLLDITPLSHDLYLHRLIAGVHLGGILLIGLALSVPWQWARARVQGRWLIVVAALTALLLLPVYRERTSYLNLNAAFMRQSQTAFTTEQLDLSALETTLRGLPPGRVYAGLPARWGGSYRIGAVHVLDMLSSDGFDMLGFLYFPWSFNGDIQYLFDESRPEEYNLFNVRYLVAPAERNFPAFVKPIGTFGRHVLYRVDTTGYFDLASSDAVFTGTKAQWYGAASTWLASDLPRQKEQPAIFLQGSPRGKPVSPLTQAAAVLPQLAPPPAATAGSVLSERVGSNTYAATVAVNRPSTLVLKVTYHPGWHAYVDGVAAPTTMVMPSYVGVQLGPGTHAVRLVYQASPLRGFLFIVGLLTLPLVALLEWRREYVAKLVAWRGPRWPFRRPDWRAMRQLAASLVPSVLEVRATGAAPQTGQPDAPTKQFSSLYRRTPEWARQTGQLNPGRFSSLVGSWAQKAKSWGSRLAARQGFVSHLPFLGVLVLMAVLAGLPLFRFEWISAGPYPRTGGDDAYAQLPRTVELFEGLKAGHLFPRWAPDLGMGYGEPTFNFYPPFFYYLAAFFHALGVNLVTSQNLAIFTLLLVAALGMYLLAQEFFGRRGGLVSAVAYVFAPWLLLTLYDRRAMSDFSAFAFIPLAFWGLYRFAAEARYRYLLVGALSLALLVLTSNNISLITFPALALFLVWLAWTGRSWRTALRGSWCLALGIGLAAFFWLPALAERNFVHISRMYAGVDSDFHYYFRSIQFLVDWEVQHAFPVGPVNLAVIGAALLLIRAIRRISPWSGTLVSFFLVLFLLAVFLMNRASLFLWEGLPLLKSIQFPWRFYSLITVSAAVLCGFPFLLLGRRRPWLANGLMVVLIVGAIWAGLPNARPNATYAVRDSDYSRQNIVTRRLADDPVKAFEPIWVTDSPQTPAVERLTLLAGKGRIQPLKISFTDYQFSADITEPARLRINTFYFPGWTLQVDGKERGFDVSEPQGLMDFSLAPGRHDVQVHLGNTPVRSWATRLSLVTLLLLLLTPWVAAWLTRLLLAFAERRQGRFAWLSSALNPRRLDHPSLGTEGAPPGPGLAAAAVLHLGQPSQVAARILDLCRRAREQARQNMPAHLGPNRISSLAPDWARRAGSGRWLVAARAGIASDAPYLAALAGLALFAGLPLLQFKIMSGHDALAYLPRHVELFEGLKAGQFLPRWQPDLAWGYGEPTFNFNPPLLSYMVAGFHAVGFTFVAGEDLACFVLLLLSGIGMYLLAGEFFGRRGGLVAAAAYMFSPYLLLRLYVNHALADYCAFAFMPLVFWALYRYSREARYRYFAVCAAATALLMLSSFPVALMAVPAFCLLLVWLAWNERSTRIALRGGACLALGLALSAFSWLPAIAETGLVHAERRVERLDFHDHFLYLHQFFVGKWGFGLSVKGPHDGLSFALGAVHLFMLAAAVVLLPWIWRKSSAAGRLVTFFLVVILLAAFFCVDASVLLWEHLSVLPPLQFPWRFLSLISVGTAFLCGMPFLFLNGTKKRLANSTAAALIAALLWFSLTHAAPQGYLTTTDADYTPSKIASEGLPATQREFEPIWVEQFPTVPRTERVTVLSGHGELLGGAFGPVHYDFTMAMVDPGRVRISTFYFPNWALRVDGKEQDFDVGEPNGLLEFSLDSGAHHVQLDLRDTPVRTWATRLSLLALLLLALAPWLPRWFRRLRPAVVVVPGAAGTDATSTLGATRRGILPDGATIPEGLRRFRPATLASHMSARTWLAAILMSGIMMHIALFPTPPFADDAYTTARWTQRLLTAPPDQFYTVRNLADHLPGDLWILLGVSHLHGQIDPLTAPTDDRFIFLLKLVSTVGDAGIAVLLYALGAHLRSRRAGLIGAALFLFNPACIFISAVWGQWDSLSACFALGALYLCLRRQPMWAFLPATCAVLIKPPYALLLPVFALALWRQASAPEFALWCRCTTGRWSVRALFRVIWPALMRSAVAGGAAIVLALVILLPFGVGMPPLPTPYTLVERLRYAQAVYPYITQSAFNIWALVADPSSQALMRDNRVVAGGITLETLGTWSLVLMGFAILVVLIIQWRKARHGGMVWACLALSFCGFMVLTRQHERYLFPAVVFAAAAAIIAPRLYWLYGLISLGCLANVAWVYTYYHELGDVYPMHPSSSWFIHAVVVLNVVALCEVLFHALPVLHRAPAIRGE